MDAHPDNDGPEPKGQGQPQEPPQWAFPTKSRCPDCGSLDTEQTSTQAPCQYRQCRRCGRTYKVMGWRI